MSQWTTVQGLVVQPQEVASGNYAARGTSNAGAATYARKQLAAPQSDLYYRIRFKSISQGANNTSLLKFRTAADASILSLGINNLGQLSYHNDMAGGSVNSTAIVSKGSWQTLQVHVQDREHSQSNRGLVQRCLGERPDPNRCIRLYPDRTLAVG